MPEREKFEIGFKNKNIAIWAKTGRIPDNVVEDTLDQIGAFLTSQSQKTFKSQGRGEIKWMARSVPNVAGALRDLATSTNIKSRRWQSRPALVDTGRLRQSITWKSNVQRRSVLVGTNVFYADRMQLGLPDTIRVTKAIKKNLNKFLKRVTKKGGVFQKKKGEAIKLAGKDEARAALGWLFGRDEITITPRKRPFVFITNIDANRITTIIVESLKKGRT